MLLRYGCLRRISNFLPRTYSDFYFQQSRDTIFKDLASPFITLTHQHEKFGRNGVNFSFSTFSQALPAESVSQVSALSFIESTFNELQGPHHRWFNIVEENKDFFKRDGTFLVLSGRFVGDSDSLIAGCNTVMFEKVKSIQQRFPHLQVIGFLYGCSTVSSVDQARLVEMVMKEYITFPFLLSNKTFPKMENGAFVLFKDFGNARVFHENSLDIGMLNEAVEELNLQQNDSSSTPSNLKCAWVKQAEVIKQPYACSSMRNLLLHFPGSISADESGNRLFLSDSNHHRIIIFDSNGKILDCIGSCPGFEDGEFESAKLVRPAASFYHEDEDCLYIVDSENHAIRRADMGRRVLETLYPTCSISKKKNSLWAWIVNKLGFERDNDMKSEEFDPQSLFFPWHLMKSVGDDDLLIINRSFETLWIMDLAYGEIKEVVRGFSKVLEICGEMVMEKLSLLKQTPKEWLLRHFDSSCLVKELPYADLISSSIAFQNHLIMCDTVGQGVMKLCRESGVCTNFQFSNFGVLGLPYWLAFPLERVYSVADGRQEAWTDHSQRFNLLPGRIDMKITVDIPSDTELVEPLKQGCIWRQARGTASVILAAADVAGSLEKVGVAQQWYDELDNLAFSTLEAETNMEDDTTTSDLWADDKTVNIDCAVNTSPGTSEVIIFAALYLKLRSDADQQDDSKDKHAARIADILNLDRNGGMSRDSFIQFLLKSNQDLRDLIFMKPLHVRIQLDSLDHPKADNNKDIILTDTYVEVNVSLNA